MNVFFSHCGVVSHIRLFSEDLFTPPLSDLISFSLGKKKRLFLVFIIKILKGQKHSLLGVWFTGHEMLCDND